MDINQNIAACIEHTNNFGSTVVHNICNGTTQVVPWGSLDWLGVSFFCTLGAIVTLFLGTLLVHVMTDIE